MVLLCEHMKHDPQMVSYLNISIKEDTLQYVDPNLIELISNRESGEIRSLALKAMKQIDVFFKKIIDIHQSEMSEQKKREKLKALFSHFSEPQHLRLGHSQPGNSGKGTTASELIKIFMNKDIHSIIMNNDGLSIPQKTPLIKHFGDDKLSDLTSNIIMNIIIDFNNLILRDLPEMNNYLSKSTKTYHYFSTSGTWKECKFTPFLFDNKETLLVPKLFTTYNQTSSLDLIIRVYIEEEIAKLETKMTKKQFIKKFIKGNRIDNIKRIFLNTSMESHRKFIKELNVKANDRRLKNK
ncbi:TPA: hypothetical protein ACRVNB_000643 [Staphylococcus aureus]